MGKASRKVERYNESIKDQLTSAEIKEQYGQKSITGKLIEGLSLKDWIGLTPVNLILMLACYVVSSVTVENYLRTITTETSAVILAHGIVTPLLIVLLFSYIKRPEGVEKPTAAQFLYRFVALGLAIGAVSAVTTLFI